MELTSFRGVREFDVGFVSWSLGFDLRSSVFQGEVAVVWMGMHWESVEFWSKVSGSIND